ncbi:hypothetical protein [Burkholderia multivorans]|uniref:hypothetical protein n=1 Tax=Burkholderia multivorans TaxID=87883 RepID=UPI00215908B5|nr:hypothetical protein [Burkholderia multivorans]
MIKPQWADFWEYRFLGEEGMETHAHRVNRARAAVMEGAKYDPLIPAQSRRIDGGKVDWNRVPLRDRRVRLKPTMPDFDAPTDSELRILWRDYTDPQVRLLILEILALRKSIERVQAWFDYVDKHIDNKGDLGGGQGPASAPAASAQGREATRDDALARLTQFDGLRGPRQWTALAEVVNSYESHTYERTHGPIHDLRRRHDDARRARAGGHRDRDH